MTIPFEQLDEIYFRAASLEGDEQREYLEVACAGDSALRREVEKFLRARPQTDRFFENGPTPLAGLVHIGIAESVGTVVGPYKLREQIGEGGFGVVYVAEQTEPVRRKVALKIIRPGMATQQVIARFEAERQALAMMDHPNISRVFDGGATETGQPYFVMELVQGVPITEYCPFDRGWSPGRLRASPSAARVPA